MESIVIAYGRNKRLDRFAKPAQVVPNCSKSGRDELAAWRDESLDSSVSPTCNTGSNIYREVLEK